MQEPTGFRIQFDKTEQSENGILLSRYSEQESDEILWFTI